MKFYAFFTEDKQGKTGLTVTVDLYRNGSSIVTAAAATELGGGVYSYLLDEDDFLISAEYVAIFKTADTGVDLQHIPHLVGDRSGEIWTSETRTLTSLSVVTEESLEAGAIACRRGDTVIFSLTNLGSLANRSKLYFTIKTDPSKTDAQATVQIEETAGLLRLKGAAGTAENASLVVDDEDAGNVTITIKAQATKELPPGRMYYDVQIVRSSGIPVSTLAEGRFIVTSDITNAIV